MRSCTVPEDCVLLGEIRDTCECAPDWQILVNQETIDTRPEVVEALMRCQGGGAVCDSYYEFEDIACVEGQCALPIADMVVCNAPPSTLHSKFHNLAQPEHPVILSSQASIDFDFIDLEVSIEIAETSDLDEGEVVTLQWVFYNHPAACLNPNEFLGSSCSLPDLMIPDVNGALGYAGPAPLGSEDITSSGTASFPRLSKRTYVDGTDDPDFVVGRGLSNLSSAEIHLMLRSHGPALAGALGEAQHGSVDGGCQVGEPNEGLCENVQIAVFSPWVGS